MNKQKFRKEKTKFQKGLEFSGLAFQMLAVIGVGVFIGTYLDGKFPNKYKAYTIIFSLAFVSLSMYQAIRQLNKKNKR